ncbi:MAG: hypothetical protein R2810_00625 [Flavobacteriales bacterium]
MRGFAGATALSGGDLDSLFVPFRCVASDITAQVPVTFDRAIGTGGAGQHELSFYFKPIRVNGHPDGRRALQQLPQRRDVRRLPAGPDRRRQREVQRTTTQRGRPPEPAAGHDAGAHRLP